MRRFEPSDTNSPGHEDAGPLAQEVSTMTEATPIATPTRESAGAKPMAAEADPAA